MGEKLIIINKSHQKPIKLVDKWFFYVHFHPPTRVNQDKVGAETPTEDDGRTAPSQVANPVLRGHQPTSTPGRAMPRPWVTCTQVTSACPFQMENFRVAFAPVNTADRNRPRSKVGRHWGKPLPPSSSRTVPGKMSGPHAKKKPATPVGRMCDKRGGKNGGRPLAARKPSSCRRSSSNRAFPELCPRPLIPGRPRLSTMPSGRRSQAASPNLLFGNDNEM